jgi:hypothetical protein
MPVFSGVVPSIERNHMVDRNALSVVREELISETPDNVATSPERAPVMCKTSLNQATRDKRIAFKAHIQTYSRLVLAANALTAASLS